MVNKLTYTQMPSAMQYVQLASMAYFQQTTSVLHAILHVMDAVCSQQIAYNVSTALTSRL